MIKSHRSGEKSLSCLFRLVTCPFTKTSLTGFSLLRDTRERESYKMLQNKNSVPERERFKDVSRR